MAEETGPVVHSMNNVNACITFGAQHGAMQTLLLLELTYLPTTSKILSSTNGVRLHSVHGQLSHCSTHVLNSLISAEEDSDLVLAIRTHC
jgi:hypothetical protein